MISQWGFVGLELNFGFNSRFLNKESIVFLLSILNRHLNNLFLTGLCPPIQYCQFDKSIINVGNDKIIRYRLHTVKTSIVATYHTF